MAVITKKEEKVEAVLAELPADFSVDQFIKAFIRLHPKDWARIQKASQKHKQANKPRKINPMPEPAKFLQNTLHNY